MSVLDASAVLAYLTGEKGADKVERALDGGAVCSAANWSEVAQKVQAVGGDWELSRALLLAYGLQIEPVTADDGEWAALRWRSDKGLSLGDRLCLALAHRMGLVALTADRQWGRGKGIRQIR